jgi:hypothetical protein
MTPVRTARVLATRVLATRVLATRVLAAGAVVLALVALVGDVLVDATLPLLGIGFTAVAPAFELRTLERRASGAQRALVAEVALIRPVTVAGRTYRPDPRGTAWSSTPVGHVLLLPALTTVFVFGWPAAGAREWVVRLTVAAGGLIPLVALDVPTVLASGVWELFPGAAPRAGLTGAWGAFMGGGGRVALAVVLAAVAVTAGHRLAARQGSGRGR